MVFDLATAMVTTKACVTYGINYIKYRLVVSVGNAYVMLDPFLVVHL